MFPAACLRIGPLIGCQQRVARPFGGRLHLRPHTRCRNICAYAKKKQNGKGKSSDLESDHLDRGLRDLVADAVESLGYRVTASDVAVLAGVEIGDAERALQAIAADTFGTLQVSDTGIVVYEYSVAFRSFLRGRGLLSYVVLALVAVGNAIASLCFQLLQKIFGASAFLVVLSTWGLVLWGSSSAVVDRLAGWVLTWTVATLWFCPQRAWGRNPLFGEPDDLPVQGILTAMFSVVFGDAAYPNDSWDEGRWAACRRAIAANRGVMTAEALGGFLDVGQREVESMVQQGQAPTEGTKDEEFVLPALLRFGGSPHVDEDGHMLYVFPQFQTSATSALSSRLADAPSFAPEDAVPFSAATTAQRALVASLGACLACGVALLTRMVAQYVPPSGWRAALMEPACWWQVAQTRGVLGFLQAYTAVVLLVTFTRLAFNLAANAALRHRNAARRDLAALAMAPAAAKKRAAAVRLADAWYSVVRPEDAVWRSDRAVPEQPEYRRQFKELDDDVRPA